MKQLRVGVIGLGRNWRRRYRRALHALREQFRVQAVCDQVPQSAEREARRLHCMATAGPTELLERDDTDAVLLLDDQWYGLWPLELACRFDKPVFCAVPLEKDEVHADATCQQVRESGLPVMMALAPRFASVTARLRELLQTQLGPPRLLLHEQIASGPGSISSTLLDWCAFVMGAAPASVQAAGTEGIEELFLEFGEGRAARLSRWSGAYAGRVRRIRIAAERGAAWLEVPHRLCWADAEGRHSHTPRVHRPVGEILLEQFHQVITQGQPLTPNLEDAAHALSLLRAAAQSRAEGRRIELSAAPV
jgi:predicted dehydrogenase